MDAHANDLLHWQTILAARDLQFAEEKARREKFPFVSPGRVALPDEKLGIKSGLLLRDPDGHALLLVGN